MALGVLVIAGVAIGVSMVKKGSLPSIPATTSQSPSSGQSALPLTPRHPMAPREFDVIAEFVAPWDEKATLTDVRRHFEGVGHRTIAALNAEASESAGSPEQRLKRHLTKASMSIFEGEAKQAYDELCKARQLAEQGSPLKEQALPTVIYLQGVTALRRGENENCILCRGESSCILPISAAARHINPEGSQLAIGHFMEYLTMFPDDREVQWLLNLAHMTLGEYPEKVDPRFVVSLEPFLNSDAGVGRFRDVGDRVGVNQLTEGGGGIMDDFDNDGLLDLVISSFDPVENMSFLRNTGTGTFEDRTEAAGLVGQLGGINCVQTDFNNDGYLDVFMIRGAWLLYPIRPSLLRNNRDGTFTDVTDEAGLSLPGNSIAATWGDYDNDGWLDLFVCCERQHSRLYHNEGNGTFKDVLFSAGIDLVRTCAKGANWLDYDNDDDLDLYVSIYDNVGGGRLFQNQGGGNFLDVSDAMGIDGPIVGFACWAWDYDNDGWLDLFNASFDRSLGDVVNGLSGKPHGRESNRLYRNEQGKRFTNVTKEAGLDFVFSAMGSNFGDVDNDGFLDMYLGTGDPDISTLVPNRMFQNLDGRRFAEITASAGMGSLQKGHGTAFGDWDRDGNVDVFIEMGGALPGDRYHNILFQNPGHENNWLTVKLLGEKSNRAAIGARIKVVTAGPQPREIHRHISSGSSFGANPLQQTIGLGKPDGVALLEIHWPTSGTTQTFQDLKPNQAVEIRELSNELRPLNWTPLPLPPEK